MSTAEEEAAAAVVVKTKDILAQFQGDWARAKEAKDPNAPFCTLATVDDRGAPKTRTVTLREVDADEGTVLLFVNEVSPKFRQLRSSSKFEVLTFWTSPTMTQYRIAGSAWSTLDEDDMKGRWKFKPKTSQLLDYYYTHHQPQSSVLKGGRREFLDAMRRLREEEFADGGKDVPFQPIATGLVLVPSEIEQWRGSVADRLHERYLYQKMPVTDKDDGNDEWQKQALVP